ncbi:MAG: hypothetical protein A3G35_10400 [candidate division NC10 bacterium RIFCSPLOWO2_12_FULL_66_18]|nr:MAG: hypothetical protein A3H39_00015 [candidate division NC10 bacterium RIFCSPLOWO2_02_FULL_66_22]OGC00345.1 MAG: hypothetical protein A3G35_10400 [candidate division NC10 bacterium RIFCSPLOWO2_12_FULL_66_18]
MTWNLRGLDIARSLARELVARQPSACTRDRIAIPDPDDYPGEKYLQAFEETLVRLRLWLKGRV